MEYSSISTEKAFDELKAKYPDLDMKFASYFKYCFLLTGENERIRVRLFLGGDSDIYELELAQSQKLSSINWDFVQRGEFKDLPMVFAYEVYEASKPKPYFKYFAAQQSFREFPKSITVKEICLSAEIMPDTMAQSEGVNQSLFAGNVVSILENGTTKKYKLKGVLSRELIKDCFIC